MKSTRRIPAMHASALALLSAIVVIACASGDVSLGSNDYVVQKTSAGGPTGDGSQCFWEPSSSHGASSTRFTVGATVPAKDCNACRCTAQGIACTTKTCPDAGTAGCFYAGRSYPLGASFPSSKDCNTCTCQKSGVVCTERACSLTCQYKSTILQAGESIQDGCVSCACNAAGQMTCSAVPGCAVCSYAGKTYSVGDTYPSATDACNTCACQADGTTSCTTKVC